MRAERRRVLAWLLGLATALSLAGATPRDWDALEPEVRALLGPLRAGWAVLAPDERERVAGQARRWLAATPEQRELLRARHRQWLERPAAERLALRERLLAWQALDESERAALDVAHARLQALPPAEQEALRQRFETLPPETRRAYLLPPQRRDAAGLALRLFPFVPPDEREATLDLLVGLGEAGREALDARSRRLAPAAREALRRELLVLPPEQRLERLR